MNRFLSKILLTSAICCFATNVPVLAKNNSHLELSPSSKTLELQPGKNTVDSFTVTNKGDSRLSYSVEVTPYNIVNEQYEANYETQTAYTQLSNWITVSENSGTLVAGEIRDVEFVVEVPEDVPAGGQYAVVMVSVTRNDDDSNIRVKNRVGIVLYGHINGETRREGNLYEHSIPQIILDDKLKASESIENTGNIDFVVSTSMKIQNFFTGKFIYNDENSPKTFAILPGTKRLSYQTWDDSPSLGVFKVKHTVRYLDQESVIEKTVILLPTWLIIVSIIALAIIIITFIIVRKCRTKKQHL